MDPVVKKCRELGKKFCEGEITPSEMERLSAPMLKKQTNLFAGHSEEEQPKPKESEALVVIRAYFFEDRLRSTKGYLAGMLKQKCGELISWQKLESGRSDKSFWYLTISLICGNEQSREIAEFMHDYLADEGNADTVTCKIGNKEVKLARKSVLAEQGA